jgi:hypothetical protein
MLDSKYNNTYFDIRKFNQNFVNINNSNNNNSDNNNYKLTIIKNNLHKNLSGKILKIHMFLLLVHKKLFNNFFISLIQIFIINLNPFQSKKFSYYYNHLISSNFLTNLLTDINSLPLRDK